MTGRYTPKRSLEALRNKWLAVNPANPKLDKVGQVLALAARDPQRFRQVCAELVGEVDDPEGWRVG